MCSGTEQMSIRKCDWGFRSRIRFITIMMRERERRCGEEGREREKEREREGERNLSRKDSIPRAVGAVDS